MGGNEWNENCRKVNGTALSIKIKSMEWKFLRFLSIKLRSCLAFSFSDSSQLLTQRVQ